MESKTENLVTIYYWDTPGGLGHVSLETYDGEYSLSGNPYTKSRYEKREKGIYASFWPENKNSRTTFFNRPPHHSTLKKDVDYYKVNFDIKPKKYRIRYLDVESINEAYSLFREKNCDWNIFGSSILKSEKNQNCAGLVFHLLKAGGLESLLEVPTNEPFTVTEKFIRTLITYENYRYLIINNLWLFVLFKPIFEVEKIYKRIGTLPFFASLKLIFEFIPLNVFRLIGFFAFLYALRSKNFSGLSGFKSASRVIGQSLILPSDIARIVEVAKNAENNITECDVCYSEFQKSARKELSLGDLFTNRDTWVKLQKRFKNFIHNPYKNGSKIADRIWCMLDAKDQYQLACVNQSAYSFFKILKNAPINDLPNEEKLIYNGIECSIVYPSDFKMRTLENVRHRHTINRNLNFFKPDLNLNYSTEKEEEKVQKIFREK